MLNTKKHPKVPGYSPPLTLSITTDGKKVIWTDRDDNAIVANGDLGAGRLWRGTDMNAPKPWFWRPPNAGYTADDYPQLVEGGYEIVYVNLSTGDYVTPIQLQQLQNPVQPTVTPPVVTPQPVEQSVVTAQ